MLQLAFSQLQAAHSVWLSLSVLLLLIVVSLSDRFPTDRLLPHIFTKPAMSSLQAYLTAADRKSVV